MDHSRWRKLIKDVWWWGWVWVGECFFWYRPTWVVPDNTHTHTHPFNGPFSRTTREAGTRKVKPIWILLKRETVSGSGISWAICKSAPRSRQITMPAPHHSVFHGPDALPAAQPTASKHWRQGTANTKWSVKVRDGHTGENNKEKDVVSERDEAVLTELVEDTVGGQLTGQHVTLDHTHTTCTGQHSTHTHTRLTAIFPGLPRWASTRKVKPIWILLKQETVSGNGISWAICKSALAPNR